MKKLEPYKKKTISTEKQVSLFLNRELVKALTVIGAGSLSQGVRHTLDTYKEEIFKAAKA